MKLSKKQKREIRQIVIGAALYLAAVLADALTDFPEWTSLILFAPSYLILGLPIIVKAVKNLAHGNMLDENFLMSIASIGAFCLFECSEGVAVMLFDRIGNFFEDYAVGRSRKNIADLLTLCPDYANVLRGGEMVQVLPEEVSVGECVIVLPGERVPLDGTISGGSTSFDTSSLTGESVPRDASVGDCAVSGYINLTGKIEVRVEKVYQDSTVSKILSLIENATDKKSRSEHFITKFSRIYTPIVVGCAVALALIPTLLHLFWPSLVAQGFSVWAYRAMLFLVVSCPCALVISVPLSFFGGIGGASKNGILVKGSNYLEALSKADTFVFDKTGTLTQGKFAVTEIRPEGISQTELLALAASAERYSTHPVASAVSGAYDGPLAEAQVTEIPGRGIRAQIDGSTVLAGNANLLLENGVGISWTETEKTAIYVAQDGVYRGVILISDVLKKESKQTISALNEFADTVMLSGDSARVAEAVAKELGIGQTHAQLLPQDKVDWMERLRKDHVCAFCGDGMNDAPVLAMADVGIAMGGVGSDAAIEAADIVIMDDNPAKIVTARRFARKTLQIVKQNIAFALVVKCAVMLFGALGMASMWEAVFADVGVLMLAVCNAMRASKL